MAESFASQYGRAVKYAADNFDQEHAAFRKAIQDSPHDPAARGAYADFLEERGLHADDETLKHLRHTPLAMWIRYTPDGKIRTTPHVRPRDLDPMQRAYVNGALWASTIEDETHPRHGRPMEDAYIQHDIHPATLSEMAEDCDHFRHTLTHENANEVVDDDPANAGYYFWLSRNGHGVNFSTPGFGDVGEILDEHTHRHFGEYGLYVGDDEMIHGHGYRKTPGDQT